MADASRIFRELYNYPYVSFRSIGRRCFASALRQAWARARELVRLISLGRTALAAELDRLRGARAPRLFCRPVVDEARAGLRKQESRIEAALALCPAQQIGRGRDDAPPNKPAISCRSRLGARDCRSHRDHGPARFRERGRGGGARADRCIRNLAASWQQLCHRLSTELGRRDLAHELEPGPTGRARSRDHQPGGATSSQAES
jgi:hypothetical protein